MDLIGNIGLLVMGLTFVVLVALLLRYFMVGNDGGRGKDDIS